jgi:hypothetical protein
LHQLMVADIRQTLSLIIVITESFSQVFAALYFALIVVYN